MTDNIAQAQKINNQSFHALQFIAKNQNLFQPETLPTLFAIAAHLPNSHPPIELISEITKRSKSSVIRDLKKLEQQGVLKIIHSHRQPNKYLLRLHGALGVTALEPKDDESLGVIAMEPKTDSWVSKSGFLGVTAMKPQETTTNNKRKEKEIFDSLSRKEFVELVTKHPKATDEELLHMIMASRLNQMKTGEPENEGD